MKYVPVPDGDSMPKRGRGCGEGPVVFPRGNAVSQGQHDRDDFSDSCGIDVGPAPKLDALFASKRNSSGSGCWLLQEVHASSFVYTFFFFSAEMAA